MFSIYADDELVYSDVYPKANRKVRSPELKMEVDNSGSLEFTIAPNNTCYETIKRVKTQVTVKKYNSLTNENDPIWRGRVIEDSYDFNQNRKLYCEGMYAFLNDTCQPLAEYKDKNFIELLTAILSTHNNRLTKPGDEFRHLYLGNTINDDKNNIGIDVKKKIEYFATAYEYTIDIMNKINELFECHNMVKVEKKAGDSEYKNYIYFFKDTLRNSNQVIQFGKNLLDFTRKFNLNNLATNLLALCKTDRESADDPVARGTTLDTSTRQTYDTTKGYGVLFPATKNWTISYSDTTIDKYKRRSFSKRYNEDILMYSGGGIVKLAYAKTYLKHLTIGRYHSKEYYDQNHINPNSLSTDGVIEFTHINLIKNANGDINPFCLIDETRGLPEYVKYYPHPEFLWNLHNEGVDFPSGITENDFERDPHGFIENRNYLALSPVGEGGQTELKYYLGVSYRSTTKFASDAVKYPEYDDYSHHKEACYNYFNIDSREWLNDNFKKILEKAKGSMVHRLQTISRCSGPLIPNDYHYQYDEYDYYKRKDLKIYDYATVIELSAEKFKSLYLTGEAVQILVWKVKKESIATRWVDFVGEDSDINKDDAPNKGCEYWLGELNYSTTGDKYAYSYDFFGRLAIGRKIDISNNVDPDGTPNINGKYNRDDLIIDPDTDIQMSNPNSMTFHKGVFIGHAFETKVDISLTTADMQTYDKLLVAISSENKMANIDLITAEDQTEILSIGSNNKPIDTSKPYPERYTTDSETGKPTWTLLPGKSVDDIFDNTKGYGVILPTTSGYRLRTESEFNEVSKNPSLNIWLNGTINDDPQYINTTEIIMKLPDVEDKDSYKVTVYVFRASQKDSNTGEITKTNSVYVSNTMHGRSGTYATYLIEGGSWQNGLRPFGEMQFGKYVSGDTEFDSKKIQLPASTNPDSLAVLVVGSYGSSPSVLLHDPKYAPENLSYITVSSVNNGDRYIRSESKNVFVANLEYGKFNTLTGAKSIESTDRCMRTVDPIYISESGSYSLSSEREFKTKVLVYTEQNILRAAYDFNDLRTPVYIPHVDAGELINVMFYFDNRKISLTDIVNVMMVKNVQNASYTPAQGFWKQSGSILVIDDTTDDDTDEPWNSAYKTLSVNGYITRTKKSTLIFDTDIVNSHFNYVTLTPVFKVLYKVPVIDSVTGVMSWEYDSSKTIISNNSVFVPVKPNERVFVTMAIRRTYLDDEEVLQTDYPNINILDTSNIRVVEMETTRPKYEKPLNAYRTYGNIEKRIEFNDCLTAQELYEKAYEYLYATQFDQIVLDVSAIDMTILSPGIDTEAIYIGDSIRTSSWAHGLDRTFPVTSVSYTLDDASSAKYTLGFDNKDSLTKILNKKKEE